MNQDLTTRAGVAKILEASGLFNNRKKFPLYLDGAGTFDRSNRSYYCGFGPWLTSNQSEAILEQLGVQVVWDCGGWECGVIKDGKDDVPRWRFYFALPTEIPRQDRELANASAVAWFCIHEPEKIKEVVG